MDLVSVPFRGNYKRGMILHLNLSPEAIFPHNALLSFRFIKILCVTYIVIS
jgi:hypothetical protein